MKRPFENKATPAKINDYRQFVLALARKIAAAHREGGQEVSPAEAAVIEEMKTALGHTDLSIELGSSRSWDRPGAEIDPAHEPWLLR